MMEACGYLVPNLWETFFFWQNWNRRIVGQLQQFFIDINNGKISLC